VGAPETQARLESPLPPIKDALEEKAGGRVLQTDFDLKDDAPPSAKLSEWRVFQKRLKQTPLFLI
jgi:hypothetical protein